MQIYRVVKVLLIILAVGIVAVGVAFHDQLGIREIPLEKLREKYEKPASRYVTIRKTDVHYCDEGQGPVILALHGISDSLHTWDGWVAQIGEHYRFVRLDLPGFGLTGPVVDGCYSREMYIQFIDAFVNELGLKTFTIVGNSLGGAIAWNYALRFPEKVTGLILIDPAGYHIELPWPLTILNTPGLRNAAAFISPRFVYSMSLKQVLGDPSKATDELVDRFYELSLRPGNRRALIDVFSNLQHLNDDPSFSRTIAGLRVPVLLLWGEEDRWIPVSQVSLWQQDVPGLQAIVYPGVGHIPQVEIPVRSAADAHQWLSRQRDPAGKPGKATTMWLLAGLASLLLIILIGYRVRKFR